jgi:hypothetical protein
VATCRPHQGLARRPRKFLVSRIKPAMRHRQYRIDVDVSHTCFQA